MTADIVSAYVSNSAVQLAELPALIKQVHQALAAVVTGAPAEAPAASPTPAVPVKKSITPDYLVCLEDGRKFKSLKRHLRTRYDMSPDQYRAKWGLPREYPMVAPSYAQARSHLAKQMGLGQGGRAAVASAEPAPTAPAEPTTAESAPTKKPRARRSKAA
jgi:predicted transcriptional regulator